MSRTIDERVVEMRFDNKQFESNVSTSMSTLDNLNKKLKLSGASKGLEEVNAASKKVDMSSLGGAVETVRAKFSALQVMAVTALANITNSAVNTGKRMAAALTIDPIKTGFQEYETQINSVQTILANTSSKGTTLQQVNSALDTLNKYADKTIYNFTEMTRNIGTFTAAGVDLETSVSAIQGIANLAAVSGSTSQQASTAMYQLSQALSSGTVKLMDWNSVVNAGMGGQVFQDALKQTARVHGIAIDKMIEDEGSFRETLSKGWLTADILTETLNQFTMAAEEGTDEWEAYKKSLMDTGYTEEQATAILKMANTATDAATKVKTFTQLWDTLKESAQSGWTESWEIMIGDFEEAKSFLTDVSDRLGSMIGESADARNAVLSGGLSSGWKQLLNAGIADEEGYKDIFKSVAKEHGTSIDDMISAEKKLDDSLTDTEAFQKALKTGFKDGSLSADMLAESVHKMADKMSNMSAEELKAAGYTQDNVKQIKELSAGLKDGSVSMDDFVSKIMRSSGRENIIQALWNAFNGLMSVVKPIKEAFREIFPPVTAEQLYKLTERIRDITAKFKLNEEQAEKVKSAFKGLFSVIKIVIMVTKEVIRGTINLVKNFSGIAKGIANGAASFGDWITGVKNAAEETNFFGMVVDKVVGFLSKAITKIKEFFSFIKSKLAELNFDKILNVLKTMWNLIVKVTSSITKVMTNILAGGSMTGAASAGVLSAVLIGVLKFVNTLTKGLGNAKGILTNTKRVLQDVRGCLVAYQKDIKANVLLKIAGAVGILAVALLLIGTIDSEKLVSSLTAIGVLMTELIYAMKAFDKLGNTSGSIFDAIKKKMNGVSGTMIALSISVLILASAVQKMGSLSWEELARGLTGIAVSMVAMAGAMQLMPKNGMSKSTGLIALATAVLIMGKAVQQMGKLSWSELAKGLAGMAVSLVAMAGAMQLMPKGMISKGLGLIAVAAALVIVGKALKSIGSLSLEQLAKGLISMGVAIAGICASMNLLPKGMISKAVGLIGVATALVIVSKALKTMGSMSWDQVAKGLVSMGVAIAGICAAMRLLPKGMISKAIGLIGVSTAIAIIGKALNNMGGMTWTEIAKGLITLGGAMGILAGGLNLMKGTFGASAALLVAAIAFAAFTPILKTLGRMRIGEVVTGLAALAGVFVVLGVAAKVLKPMIGTLLKLSVAMLVFGAGCTLVGVGILAISIALTSLGASLVVLASSIIEVIKTIVQGLGSIIVAACDVIIDSAPAIAEALIALVSAGCAALKGVIPEILQLIVDMLVALKDYIPQIVDVLVDFLIETIDALAERMPELIGSVVNFIGKFFSSLASTLGTGGLGNLLDSLEQVAGIFIALGLTAKIISTIPISGAVKGIASLGIVVAGIAAILSALGGLAQIQGFDWLISEGTRVLGQIGTAIGSFVGNIVGSFLGGVSTGLPQIASNLAAFAENIKPFLDGMRGIDPSVAEGAKSMALAVLALTGAAFLEGIASFISGGSNLANLAEQLVPFGKAMNSFAKEVAGIDAEAIQNGANAGKALAELYDSIPSMGGVISWFTGSENMNALGEQLVPFAKAMAAFSREVSGGQINEEAISAAASAGKMLGELYANLPKTSGVISWFTGGQNMSTLAEQLVPFGKAMKDFSSVVVGVNGESVTAAVSAGKALGEMYDSIPSMTGVIGFFTGGSNLAALGEQLVPFGESLKEFSLVVTGSDSEAIMAAVNAGKALGEMYASVPSLTGVIGFFTGGNNMAALAPQLIPFGQGIKGFSDAVIGINPEAILTATQAGKALAEMADTIPNEGGVLAWFAGENSMANFASQLPVLGAGLLAFSTAATGINPEVIITAANAAKSLAEMADIIPNEGGVAAWFAGENSMASFASQLPVLGAGLLGFSLAATGINPEVIITAANAAKSLAEMADIIPNEGGVAAWFAGENSMASFASQLPVLGAGLLGFSLAVTGINPEVVIAAADAAKKIAEMADTIPNEGGVAAWFAGENSISKFASQLPILGAGLLGFSLAATGINADAITAASSAAKNLAEMTEHIPKEGGVAAWFAGENSISKFASQLPILGAGLLGFSLAATGINADAITAASSAAKNLAEMTEHIPKEGGIKAWFSGDSGVATFSANLPTLGTALKEFSDSVEGINPENVTAAAKAAKSLAEMAETTPKNTDNIISFGDNLVKFGGKLNEYFFDVGEISSDWITASKNITKAVSEVGSKINGDSLKSASKAIADITKTLKNCAAVKESSTSGFVNAVKKLGGITADGLLKSFKDANTKMVEAGKELVSKFVSGIDQKKNSAKTAGEDLAKKASSGIRDKYSSFKNAGKYLGDGLVEGINAKQTAAYNAGFALGKKAVQGEKDGQESNSPSKATIKAGKWLGEGLIIGINRLSSKVYDSGHGLGKTAATSISSAISKASDLINGGMDAQPTIRPVVDLSDVRSSANAISGMFSGTQGIGVQANLNAINVAMNRKLQNGNNDDIISAINKLNDNLEGTRGDTYNFAGITYDNGDEISNAVQTLVRAAKMGRRV